MSLTVWWDGVEVGCLERVDERSREYRFRYLGGDRAVSLSLPRSAGAFDPAQTRPFFEALLPEGTLREQLAGQLRLAASDSYGLLSALGRDCAGALQIVESRRMSDPPGVRWLAPAELDDLIGRLPSRPLGLDAADGRLRLSLAGVQRKAVLLRSQTGDFGQPLNGMPSTHILKPDLPDGDFAGIAANEHFCMRLAARSGVAVADTELLTIAGRPCLVVTRFDRDQATDPPRRLHQEDLCQALGITPDFKYQHEGWAVPSHRALARVLDEHGSHPGADRLAAARAAVFNFVVGNADAHAKNVSLLHQPDGRVRLAPLYDLVCTSAYPDLNRELALAVGDELDPQRIGVTEWGDLATDYGLRLAPFERVREQLAATIARTADELRGVARAEGWHEPVIDAVADITRERAATFRFGS